MEVIKQHLFPYCRGEIPTGDDILEQDDIVKLKRCIFSAQVKKVDCTIYVPLESIGTYL